MKSHKPSNDSPSVEHSKSLREEVREELLAEALAHSGVKEAMIVYGNWKEKDQKMNVFRSATKVATRMINADSSNI